MSLEIFLSIVYGVAVLGWLVIMILVTRNALAAKKLTPRVTLFSVLFIAVSVLIISASLFFGTRALYGGSTATSTNNKTTTSY